MVGGGAALSNYLLQIYGFGERRLLRYDRTGPMHNVGANLGTRDAKVEGNAPGPARGYGRSPAPQRRVIRTESDWAWIAFQMSRQLRREECRQSSIGVRLHPLRLQVQRVCAP
jgi:hypothetical protein